MKRKIAIITTAFGYGLENREKTYKEVFNSFSLDPWYCTREELLKSPEGVEGIIVGVEKADETLFSTCKDSRVIVKFGVGMDNFDKESASRHSVELANLPGINSDAVAEMAMTLILSVSRSIQEMHNSCLNGQFRQICSHSIKEKTIGIIGIGSIGKKVAKLAKAFGMNCIGFDVIPFDADGILSVDFDTILANSDIITIHIPLTKENYHLFDRKVFKAMKKGSIIINTSRGGIVDENALAESLKNGDLAGAGLDVFESRESILEVLNSPGSVCTPHVAAYTHETLRHMEKTIIEKIAYLLNNQTLKKDNRRC